MSYLKFFIKKRGFRRAFFNAVKLFFAQKAVGQIFEPIAFVKFDKSVIGSS